MSVTPSQFKTLSDSLLSPNMMVTDNMVQMLRNKFNHFMKHSFHVNNINGCNDCQIIQRVIMDHLSKPCPIKKNKERCYFHELQEHINICRHMILRGDHEWKDCMICNQSRTTKEYRDRYLHASQCDRKNCNSRSCLKWQYFIHHLKNCPGCWVCYDEDRINGVYLSLHRRDDANPPQRKPMMTPQQSVLSQQPYLHSAPHPSQGVPLQPASLPSPLPYSQSSGDYLPHSRYNQSVLRSGPQYASSTYDTRRLPLSDVSKRPRTGSQTTPPYGYPQASVTQSPLTKTSPALPRSVSPAVSSFPHDSQGLYLQQRAATYGLPSSQRPNPLPGGSFAGSAAGSFQRAGSSLSDVRRTQVAASTTGMMMPREALQQIKAMPPPQESRSPIPPKDQSLTAIKRTKDERAKQKLAFDPNFDVRVEEALNVWLRTVMREVVTVSKKRRGVFAVDGLKFVEKSAVKGYVNERLGASPSQTERRNLSSLETQHKEVRGKSVVTVDDVRNYVKRLKGTETMYMQRRAVL